MARRIKDQVEQSILIRNVSVQHEDAVGYMGRVLVQMTLPHSDPGDVSEYVRRNGYLEMVVQPAPRLGLPYGSIPRLILSWVSTEVVQKKERTVKLGDSLSSFMRNLGMDPRGGPRGNINPVKEQMARLFGSRIAVVKNDRAGYQMKPIQLADDVRVWWDPQKGVKGQSELFDSYVELGTSFYEMLIERPVPVDQRALKFLKDSPLGLDLYMWLTHRVSYLKHEDEIPWAKLLEQFGSDYTEPKEFARKAKEQMERIKLIWPQLRYDTPRGRLVLHPSPTHVPRETSVFSLR